MVPESAASWMVQHVFSRHSAGRDAKLANALNPASTVVAAQAELRAVVDGYAETPIHSLPELAAACGLRSLHAKDEGGRLGQRSFKPLGALFAVLTILRTHLDDRSIGVADALPGGTRRRDVEAAALTVVAATDGNWGTALAWAARLFGLCCVIVLAAGLGKRGARGWDTCDGRRRRARGGDVRRVRPGVQAPRQRGGVAPGTRHDGARGRGHDAAVRGVGAGYAIVGAEIAERCVPPPTHIFVNAGVGGFVQQMYRVARSARERAASDLEVAQISTDALLTTGEVRWAPRLRPPPLHPVVASPPAPLAQLRELEARRKRAAPDSPISGGGDTLYWERRTRAFEVVAARHELGVRTREAAAAEAFVAWYEADFAARAAAAVRARRRRARIAARVAAERARGAPLTRDARAAAPKCALHSTRRRLLQCGGAWRLQRVQRRRLLCVSGVLR
jgi:hypothetical protein